MISISIAFVVGLIIGAWQPVRVHSLLTAAYEKIRGWFVKVPPA